MDLFPLLRPLLFRQDAETAHHLTLRLAGLAQHAGPALLPTPPANRPHWAVNAFGLHFPNPIGLAAGMDKDAQHLPLWFRLGFGYVEVGTVTPRPQPGRVRPRIFRLKADQGLINRMGFPNQGQAVVAKRLDAFRQRPDGPGRLVGVNLGKNADTDNHAAAEDYVQGLRTLAPYMDYAVVNVSSPNTTGLRDLQGAQALRALLAEVQNANQGLPTPRPLLVKVAPDLTPTELDDVVDAVRHAKFDGVVATNTTIARPNTLRTPQAEVVQMGQGGLSGAPLATMANAALAHLAQAGVPVIGVGGLDGPKALAAKRAAGAQLFQLYTALVYHGPALVSRLLHALDAPQQSVAQPQPAVV